MEIIKSVCVMDWMFIGLLCFVALTQFRAALCFALMFSVGVCVWLRAVQLCHICDKNHWNFFEDLYIYTYELLELCSVLTNN